MDKRKAYKKKKKDKRSAAKDNEEANAKIKDEKAAEDADKAVLKRDQAANCQVEKKLAKLDEELQRAFGCCRVEPSPKRDEAPAGKPRSQHPNAQGWLHKSFCRSF